MIHQSCDKGFGYNGSEVLLGGKEVLKPSPSLTGLRKSKQENSDLKTAGKTEVLKGWTLSESSADCNIQQQPLNALKTQKEEN